MRKTLHYLLKHIAHLVQAAVWTAGLDDWLADSGLIPFQFCKAYALPVGVKGQISTVCLYTAGGNLASKDNFILFYSKAFLEAHREEITLHKAAKAAFDEAGLQKLPKVKALDAEFTELLTKKKAAYPDYRKARNEMQELVRAQKNVERFFAEEKPAQENEQAR